MVLHQEPSGSVIPDVHRKMAREEGKLVVGSHRSAEQVGGYRDRALEACAAWPRWVMGLPYLIPLSGRPIGGKNTANVGILWLDGSRPRVAEGVAKG